MQITTIGLDLAKSIFQVHGVDAEGHVVVRKALRRAQVLPFFAKLPSCLVGMEACGTSHRRYSAPTRPSGEAASGLAPLQRAVAAFGHHSGHRRDLGNGTGCFCYRA